MNVTSVPAVERFSASSDFEEKLVTRSREGTSIRLSTCPHGVSSSRNTGEVTPKLPSTRSLLNTNGYVPSATAGVQALPLQPAGAR
jgi:hypothetical protein